MYRIVENTFCSILIPADHFIHEFKGDKYNVLFMWNIYYMIQKD